MCNRILTQNPTKKQCLAIGAAISWSELRNPCPCLLCQPVQSEGRAQTPFRNQALAFPGETPWESRGTVFLSQLLTLQADTVYLLYKCHERAGSHALG